MADRGIELRAACRATAGYAHDLLAHYVFGARPRVDLNDGSSTPTLCPVPDVLRARAREVAPMAIAVATLDAVSIDALAVVEGTYADTPADRLLLRPWQRGFVQLLRSGGLRYGRSHGAFASDRFVTQVRADIPLALPDAPPGLSRFDETTCAALERAFVDWTPSYGDGDPAKPESWSAFERAARTWSTTCGASLPFESALASQAKSKARRGRSVLTQFTRTPHPRPASLVTPFLDDDDDVLAVRAARALGDQVVTPVSREFAGGSAIEPAPTDWRVARTAAELLVGHASSAKSAKLFRVDDAMRAQARGLAVAALAVGWFSDASPLHLRACLGLCDRALEVRYGGLERWQAGLVWVIDHARGEIGQLRSRGEHQAIDLLLRERVIAMNGRLPEDMSEVTPFEPTSSEEYRLQVLREALSRDLAEGRPRRGAVGPHGYAVGWMSAYGLPFPIYPSSSRPKRAARRV